jgi:hypothetical protein
LIFWSGDRIDIKIPRNIPPDDYHIMVVKGGASKMAKDKDRIKPPYQAYTATEPVSVSTQRA